jgi:hypothetical protein
MTALEQIISLANGVTRNDKDFVLKCCLRALRDLSPNDQLTVARQIEALSLQLTVENDQIKTAR